MLLTLAANDASRTTLAIVREDGTDTGFHVLEGAQWGNVAWDQHYSGARGTQGAQAASGEPQNRPVVIPMRVQGTDKNSLLTRLSLLGNVADLMRRYGGTITVRLTSSTYKSIFVVQSGSASMQDWTPRSEASSRAVITLEAVCSPYVHGEPMAFTDGFDGYSFDAQGLTNFIKNPGFENGSTLWTNLGLTTMQAGGGAHYFHSAGTSLFLENPTTGGDKYAVYSVGSNTLNTLRGQTVTFSAWVYKEVGWSVGSGSPITVLVYDGVNVVQDNSMSSITAGQWTRVSVTLAVSASATGLDLRVYNGGVGDVYWDDTMLQVGSAATPYFDGDSDTAEWTGTRSLSTSRQIVGSKFDRYSYDSGSGTLYAGGGALCVNSTTSKVLYANSYDYSDAQATVKVTTGATVGTYEAFVILRRTSANNYLMGGFTSGGSTFGIYTVTNGTATLKASSSIGMGANIKQWVRLRAEGAVITLDLFTGTQPSALSVPTSTLSYTLTTTEAAQFASGKAGLRLIASSTDWTYDDFKVEPFAYRSKTVPEEFTLTGVPGDAPALVDVSAASGAVNLPFAMFGWSDKPQPWNLVQNGDLDGPFATSNPTVASGWFTGNVYGINTGATATRQTAVFKFGAAAMQVVTTNASTAEGASYQMYRRFKKGVTYTASVWVKASSATTLELLLTGGDAENVVTTVSATTSWQQFSVTYTPTSTYEFGRVMVRTQAAAVATFYVDGVSVYEGTTAPTQATQINGAGAYPPIGIINMAGGDPNTTGGWAIAANASARSGYELEIASASSATNYLASVLIDPSLISADDYTRDELDVEVWGRFLLSSTLTSTTVTPFVTSLGNSVRYTHEWGSTGVTLTKQNSTLRTFNRLGTLTFSCNRLNPERQALGVLVNVGSGSSGALGLDYLVLVPAKQRALSPTGKTNDSTYPYFIDGSQATNKIVQSDLTGWREVNGSNRLPDHGLGGSLIEVPSGASQWIVKASEVVPDDPSATTNTDVTNETLTVGFSPTPRFQFFRSP